MKKFISLVLGFAMILSLTGCSLFEDRLLVANEHGYSGEAKDIASVSSGENTWIGNDVAVIDSSSFKDDKKITASAGLVVNLDEAEAVWGKSIYKKINPGEVAMLFTAYTVLQNAQPEDQVTVASEVLSLPVTGYSTLGLEQGDILTVEQLLYSMLLCSDVDSANALAIGISGSIDDFVDEMNAQAKKLGCVDTKLTNAAGYYSTTQYTTCYDLYLLMNRLLQDQRFVNIITDREYSLEYESADGLNCQYQLKPDASILSADDLSVYNVVLQGGKVGSSSTSGYHLVLLSSNTEGEQILSIILGADSESKMNKQMKRILKKVKN